jgi:carbon starvation protein
MAHLFSRALGGGGAMALWYHFALMFEALFILTTLDAGTRVGRFMLQDLGRHVWPAFGRTSWMPATVLSSAMIVAMWGHFLWQGVIDPLGGVNSLWPLFGISNQLLAAVALCVGTTIIIKMGKARYAWATLLPLAWLVIVTMSAGVVKLFSSEPKLGFLARAHMLQAARAAGTLPPGVKSATDLAQMIANDYLDAAVTAFFLVSVVVILADSAREWYAVLSGAKAARSTEVPFQPRVFAAGD